MITRWSNQQGTFTQSVEVEDGAICNVVVGVPDGEYTLHIDFRSSGYSYSGSWNNPPEHEEERTLDSAYLVDADDNEHTLPQETQEALFEIYEEDVYTADGDFC